MRDSVLVAFSTLLHPKKKEAAARCIVEKMEQRGKKKFPAYAGEFEPVRGAGKVTPQDLSVPFEFVLGNRFGRNGRISTCGNARSERR